MSGYRIRPHHGLCIAFFKGEGYSEEFTRNMETLIEDLVADSRIRLTMEADDICAACPSCIGNQCLHTDKVERMDRAVASLCGWEDRTEMSWSEIQKTIQEELIEKKQMKLVCCDCQWSYICMT